MEDIFELSPKIHRVEALWLEVVCEPDHAASAPTVDIVVEHEPSAELSRPVYGRQIGRRSDFWSTDGVTRTEVDVGLSSIAGYHGFTALNAETHS